MSTTLTYYKTLLGCILWEVPIMADKELRHAIESLFYAYRDFTGIADTLLKKFGFGRAHHRVIYFVGAHPGITVSELLDILKITKQSLSRVLSVLITEDYVLQRKNEADLRRRHLFLTEKGIDLEHQLTKCQSQWISSAYEEAGPIAVKGFEAVLRGIINREDQKYIKPSIKDSSTK
jgi:DNA-binding MarR family transcriptional regulator